jgi:hypothetical protein
MLPGVVGWMARQGQEDCHLSVVSGIGRRREVDPAFHPAAKRRSV